jgi:hypothetical protein
MAEHASLPKARLRLQLENEVLLGMAGGQHVHCLVRCPSDPSGEDTIEEGLYRILPPVEHPGVGIIAILIGLLELAPSPQLGTRRAVDSAIQGTGGHVHLLSHVIMHQLPAGGATSLGSLILSEGRGDPWPPAHNVLGATSLGSLILSGGPLGGPNVIVVTTGFEELMDLLEESGGGTLEVEP